MGARDARWRRRKWPYTQGTPPPPVPPARSAERSTAAGGRTKGTAWMRRKRAWRHEHCGRGCSPRRQPGPDRRWLHGPCGIRHTVASAPAHGPRHRSEQREVRARRHASARATQGNPPTPRLDGGGTQPERLKYVGWAGGAPAALAAPPPPPLTPPGGSARARGGNRGSAAGATLAGRTPGRLQRPPPPSSSQGLADVFGIICR